MDAFQEATHTSLPVVRKRAYSSFSLSRFANLIMVSVLMLADGLGLLLAGVLAVQFRYQFGNDLDPTLYLPLIQLLLLFIAIYAWRGLYQNIGLDVVEELRKLTVSTTMIFLSLAAFTFLVKSPPVYSRVTFILAWLLAIVFVPAMRVLVRVAFTRMNIWGEPVAVIGPLENALETADFFLANQKIGLKPVVIFGQLNGKNISRLKYKHLPLYPVDVMTQYCVSRHIRSAVVAYGDLNDLGNIREEYHSIFRHVHLVSLQDEGLRLSGVTVRKLGPIMGLDVHHTLLEPLPQFIKRILDIIGSSLGILFLAPFLLLIAIGIYIDSPGRIFYYSTRVSKNGKLFKMLKLRTMQQNADKVLKSHLERDPLLRQEWEQYQKLKNDPRITRMGRLLRRFSIDELPQLWNVLRGEMSLVGPRPILKNQIELYGKVYDRYTRVTPGMTGLWQVSGRNQTTFTRRSELDVHYVMNWSVWLDIYLLIRTIGVVVRQDGAS